MLATHTAPAPMAIADGIRPGIDGPWCAARSSGRSASTACSTAVDAPERTRRRGRAATRRGQGLAPGHLRPLRRRGRSRSAPAVRGRSSPPRPIVPCGDEAAASALGGRDVGCSGTAPATGTSSPPTRSARPRRARHDVEDRAGLTAVAPGRVEPDVLRSDAATLPGTPPPLGDPPMPLVSTSVRVSHVDVRERGAVLVEHPDAARRRPRSVPGSRPPGSSRRRLPVPGSMTATEFGATATAPADPEPPRSATAPADGRRRGRRHRPAAHAAPRAARATAGAAGSAWLVPRPRPRGPRTAAGARRSP